MFSYDSAKVIKSEVFAVMPEALRGKPSSSAMRQSKSGTTLEGPSFDRQGNLYFTDIPNGRIFRVSELGQFELISEYKGRPNGLKIHRDGRIFVADNEHGIMLLDPAKGSMTTLLRGPDREHFKGVNDLVFGKNGDLYFTDQGATGLHDPTGRVYRYDAEGKLNCLIDTIPSPNGIVLSEAEDFIYVAVTRANAVWNLPLAPGGAISRAGLFAQLPCLGPDGLAADAEGNIAIAMPFLGAVWLVNRLGLPAYRVDSCRGAHLTNIAYGGPGNRWLYMTEGDSYSILRAEMPFPGRLMYSHMC